MGDVSWCELTLTKTVKGLLGSRRPTEKIHIPPTSTSDVIFRVEETARRSRVRVPYFLNCLSASLFNHIFRHFRSRGGGIGGLTLAVALSRLDLDKLVQVDIYESTAKLTQIGAGITVCPRGWDIIKDLGLDEDLTSRLGPEETSPDSPELSR